MYSKEIWFMMVNLGFCGMGFWSNSSLSLNITSFFLVNGICDFKQVELKVLV